VEALRLTDTSAKESYETSILFIFLAANSEMAEAWRPCPLNAEERIE
jgi:hypothetical protein